MAQQKHWNLKFRSMLPGSRQRASANLLRIQLQHLRRADMKCLINHLHALLMFRPLSTGISHSLLHPQDVFIC